VYGWPAPDDSGYAQPAQAGTALGFAAAGPPAAGHGGTGPGHQRPGRRGAGQGDPGGASRRGAARVKTREQAPGTEADTRPPGTDATATLAPAKQRPAKQRPAKKPAKRPGKKQPAGNAPVQDAPRLLSPAVPAEQPTRNTPRQKSAGKSRRRLSTRVLALAGASAVVAGAAVVVLTRSGGGVPHVVTTPEDLGTFSKQPQLAVQMRAAALRQQILKQSAGEVHNAVYAVYQNSASSAPQIILFIGGNLSGTSAGSFISAFTGKLADAATTSPGPLGGAAACVPSVDGRVAECVWADNDTFGVFASQSLSTTTLAAEMRQMRPMVEHRASAQQ
jgi:hypothetical protein